jgi:glycine hydroxymethyltransferase
MNNDLGALSAADRDIFDLIKAEEQRQFDNIRLIASENYVSMAVLEATGSVFTNKYSEGYPGKRYYEGQQFVDQVELLAINRAKELFGAEHINVQPYSGSPANLAVYLAFLEPGDTILGMSLPHGGHLTHGAAVSISGRYFNAETYGINPHTGLLDYDELRATALSCRPKIIIAGHSAYPRVVDFERYRAIADEAGALLLVDMAHFAGLVAGGAHPSPVPLADVVTTTTHKSLRGPRGAIIMCKQEYAKAIDKAVFPGIQGGPHNHSTAAMAVAFKEALQPEFSRYAHQIVDNSRALAETLNEHGFDLVTGGSDTHVVLVDLRNKQVSGKLAARALDRAGLVVNYNAVPFDTCKPTNPSGIRLGTAAVTTRGFKEAEMRRVGDWINRVLTEPENEKEQQRVSAEIKALCRDFSPPGPY